MPVQCEARESVTSQPRDAPQFYLTSPSACPYLPGKEERKVFTHIVGKRARDLNEILTQGGFRRSQTIAYRPACENCRACVSVRVVVNEFQPSGNLRRVMKAQPRPHRRGDAEPADLGPVFPLPPLPRRPPHRRRHGRHDGARLLDDGRGQPCRHAGDRVSPPRDRQRHHRPRRRRPRRRLPDRRDGRRPLDGLLVLRSCAGGPLASAPS